MSCADMSLDWAAIGGLMRTELIERVWAVFGEDRISTKEVESRLYDLFDYRCPDDLAKTLMKMRSAGHLKGEVSLERGGWMWWVDAECKGASPPAEL